MMEQKKHAAMCDPMVDTRSHSRPGVTVAVGTEHENTATAGLSALGWEQAKLLMEIAEQI